MDLKSFIDPKTQYIFLVSQGLPYAYKIVHVVDETLYFTALRDVTEKFESGYFLAPNGSGIVQFEAPEIEYLTEKAQEKLDQKLFRINFNKLDFSITNRRLYMRYELKEYLPIVFRFFGEMMVGKLVNVSEGGIRLCIDTPLQRNILCQFEIKLNNDFTFKTDGLVVYADPEEEHTQIMLGISFISPDFKSDEEKDSYFLAKQKLMSGIHDISVRNDK